MSHHFRIEGMDWPKDICRRTEADAKSIWAVMGCEISPTADLLRELLFIRMWKEYVGHLIKTDVHDEEVYQKICCLLTQSKEEFVDMALDR